MHLALFDASLGTPHASRNFQREIDASLSVFHVNQGEMPPPVGRPEDSSPPASFDGAIISGSQSSVYDDRPWIQEFSRWVEGAIADGLPILGVCWGHQLLAQILGGTVKGGSYELGYVTVTQEADDPIWTDIPNPFTVFATHSDHVVALPPGATLLAANETGIQSFRHERVYAVQFHPEYDRHTAEAMINSKDLADEDLQAALDTCTPENVAAAKAPKQLFDNFLDHVATTGPEASTTLDA